MVGMHGNEKGGKPGNEITAPDTAGTPQSIMPAPSSPSSSSPPPHCSHPTKTGRIVSVPL
jgi:hypothetical protein